MARNLKKKVTPILKPLIWESFFYYTCNYCNGPFYLHSILTFQLSIIVWNYMLPILFRSNLIGAFLRSKHKDLHYLV